MGQTGGQAPANANANASSGNRGNGPRTGVVHGRERAGSVAVIGVGWGEAPADWGGTGCVVIGGWGRGEGGRSLGKPGQR
jgi:hypothetical protein